MKKAASALALAGVITFAGASAATATNYPAQPPGLTVENGTTVVAPGALVPISGSGFQPFEDIEVVVTYNNDPQAVAGLGVNGLIILNQQVAAFVATAQGDGTFRAQVPVGTEEGTYTITATGQRSGVSFSTVVAVSAKSGQGPATPTTPSDPATAGTVGNDAAAGSGLADTGADSSMLLWGAAGALALGAGVVSISVARRKKTA